MDHTFYVKGRFHPGHSLLGRWLHRVTGDAWRAEALLILILGGLALGLLLVHYSLYLLLQAGPSTPGETWLIWAGQLGLAAAVFLTCMLGVEPPVRVTCTPRELYLQQGRRTCTVPYDAITSASLLSPQLFHRHYRRHAATRAFACRPERKLLLLQTAEGPVVLGLDLHDPAQAALLSFLTGTRSRHPYASVS